MAKRIFQSKTVLGRDGDVCGKTGNMSKDNARLKELAEKRGIGILMGGSPVTIGASLETSLTDPGLTEAKAKVAFGTNAQLVYYDSNIKFKDLADNYCGINSKTQIIFIYNE